MFGQPAPTVIDPRDCECNNCETGLHAPEDSVGAWEALMALHYGDIPDLRNATDAPFLTYMDIYHFPVVRSLPGDCEYDTLKVTPGGTLENGSANVAHRAMVSYRDHRGAECSVELKDCLKPSEVRIIIPS